MCVLIEFLVLGLHSSKQQKSRFVVPMGSIDWGYRIARPAIIDCRRMLIASEEEAGESDGKGRGCFGQKSIARVIPIAPHIKRVTAVLTPLRLERSRKIHAAQTNPMPVTTWPAPVLCVECCRSHPMRSPNNAATASRTSEPSVEVVHNGSKMMGSRYEGAVACHLMRTTDQTDSP